MRKMVDTILRKYGTEVVLQREQADAAVRCFFQPVSSTSWQSMEHAVSPLGYSSRAEYICIAPADAGIQEDEILRVGERSYLARRVEAYYYCGEMVYQWVLCVEKGGADTWGA